MTLDEFDEWAFNNNVEYRIGTADMLFNRPFGFLYYVSIRNHRGWMSCSSPAPLEVALDAAVQVVSNGFDLL